MSQENVKKVGCLSKLPVKGLVKKWVRRWFILYGTSHEGVVRIEYYDSQECAKNNVGKRTIPLRDSRELCTAPGNKLHPYVFQLTSQIGNHVWAADSQLELDDWISQIKQAVQEDRLKRRRTKGQSLVVASGDDTPFELNAESGLSYKNRVDSGAYRVTIEETETSVKMALSGTYSLELTPSLLALIAPSGAKIFTLSYRFLRNYGKQSGQFHIHTGKNSPIGEGKLIFVTSCSKEVFGIVHNNIKKLRENAPARPNEPVRKTSSETQPTPNREVTKPVARPQPFQSVPAPPPPQQKAKRQSLGNRPGSKEIADAPVAGTYRASKDLEEVGQVTGSTGGNTTADQANALYATVDMDKKRSSKMLQQKKKGKDPPKQLQPYEKGPRSGSKPNPEEALYADPYEADPAYRAPPVPVHKSSISHDPRDSVDLVNLEENAFYDSFEDDDDNLEPLAEGASNPLDSAELFGGENAQPLTEGASNLLDATDPFGGENTLPSKGASNPADPFSGDNSRPSTEGASNLLDAADLFGGETTQTPKPDLMTNGMDKELQKLDFGFGPGNLSPLPTGTASENPQSAENLNFDFDFGGDLGALPVKDNPFSSNLAGVEATGNQDFADFHLGKLDANFFEKLEAIEVSEQQQNKSMNKEEFDQFWSNMDTSVSNL